MKTLKIIKAAIQLLVKLIDRGVQANIRRSNTILNGSIKKNHRAAAQVQTLSKVIEDIKDRMDERMIAEDAELKALEDGRMEAYALKKKLGGLLG